MLVLSSCTQKNTTPKIVNDTQSGEMADAEQSKIFESRELWIRFNYFPERYEWRLFTDKNRINFEVYGTSFFIEVWKKDEKQTIEDTILGLIEKEWKNPKECRVVKRWSWWWNEKYSEYVIDLTESTVIYTPDELREIEEAEKSAQEDGGPFGGEWKKREIHNKRLVEKCSYYADPLGLWTSKSTSSSFVYNDLNTFVFLPGIYDAPFYEPSSIELFE
jgi:hypothetical protein